ncbi:hypothetical protein ACFVYF_18955 [Streptomyces sp. NPDC058274]
MPKHRRFRGFRPLHTITSSKSLARKAESWTVPGDKKAIKLIHRILKGL